MPKKFQPKDEKDTKNNLCAAIDTFLNAVRKNLRKTILLNENSKFLDYLVNAKNENKEIYVTGSGRSGDVIDEFVMRLTQMGFTCHIVGNATTPAIKKGAILIATSGSGRTPATKNIVKAAKSNGAIIIVISSYPRSPTAKLAELVIQINGRRYTEKKITGPIPEYEVRQLKGQTGILAPLGTIFEISTAVYFDLVVEELMKRLNISEIELKNRHANL